jgi:D-glycero-alpha-D-manno-heptose-7-phosphate kinase
MILTRTPLRISIGGGGTDLPSYSREYGGFVIAAAITKYVYIGLHRSFSPGYILKYSESEYAAAREEIRHRLIREVLMQRSAEDGLEIVSLADVPSGTGLGSSGSFLVGLLHALCLAQGEVTSAEKLAADAAEIEIVRLGDPVGKQDQYIAAYGGLRCLDLATDGTVGVTNLQMAPAAIEELRDSLMLFFVGKTRSASSLLSDQKRRSEESDREMLENLHFTKQLGLEIKQVLEAGEVHRFGALMHQHWLRKRERSAGITSAEIDQAYEHALRAGASGGKLVGAGGGGFLLLQTTDRARLQQAMSELGMSEMDFGFDFEGSTVLLGE